MPPRLGEILLQANLITPQQLEEAVSLHRRAGMRIGTALIQLGYASEDDVAWALATQLRIPYVHVSPDMVDPAAVQLLPAHLMERFEVFPVLVSGDELTLAMADPTDAEAIAEVERATGLQVVPAIDLGSNIRRLIRSFGRVRHLRRTPEPAEIQFHLSVAAQAGAREIYFEPSGSGIRVRYRTPAGLVESQGPRVHPVTLTQVGEDSGYLRLRIPLANRTVVATLRTVPTPVGHALVGWIDETLPGAEGVIQDKLEAVLEEGGILVVGCPDSLFRRRLLRAAARMAARVTGARTVAAGLRSPQPLEGVLEVDSLEGLDELWAEYVVADAGWDLEGALRLCRSVRPGSLLLVGLPYLRVSWAVEALRSGERLLFAGLLTGVLCGMPVPALCGCAEVCDVPPPDWPLDPVPARWASAAGCDQCRGTGYVGEVFIYEWYRPGPELAEALRAPVHALPEILAPALSPSLEACARTAVEALQAEPRAVRALVRIRP